MQEAKPDPAPSPARTDVGPDTDFVWRLRARIVVSYVTGYDEAGRLVDLQEYGSDMLTYEFAPGQAAVAEFPIDDDRVVQIAIDNLRRDGIRAMADCATAVDWFWEGSGRSVVGCPWFNEPTISLPSRHELVSNSGETVRIEIEDRRVLSPDEAAAEPKTASGDPISKPKPIDTASFESNAWQREGSRYHRAWDPADHTSPRFVVETAPD